MQEGTALTMLAGNRLRLRRALDRGEADVDLTALSVIYVSRLERHVREGRKDGEHAVAIAARLARAITQTPEFEEDRSVPRGCPCCGGGRA